MISIVAKPTVKDALALAHKHGMTGIEYSHSTSMDDVFLAPDTDKNKTAVMSWFIAGGPTAPFAPGTCLLYNWGTPDPAIMKY